MRGVAMFVDRGRRTTYKCYNLYSTVEMLTTRDGPELPAVIDAKARYWSKIAIVAPYIGGVGILPKGLVLKTGMVWLPDGEKSLKISLLTWIVICVFILFFYTHCFLVCLFIALCL